MQSRYLTSLLRAADEHGTEESLSRLGSTITWPALVEVMQAIRESGSAGVERLARNSFEHKNGFKRMVLGMGTDSSAKLRVHLWKSGQGEARIHNHSWNYFSCVIRGTLEVTRYTLVRRRAGSHRLLSMPNKAGARRGDEEYVDRSMVTPEPAETMTYGAGESYSFQIGDFHSVRAGGEDLCLTAVLQGPHLASRSAMLIEPNEAFEGAIAHLTQDQYRRALVELVTLPVGRHRNA